MNGKGHNSGQIQPGRLKSFIERIEKLEEESKAIRGDVKDVYSEAKGIGYDVKTMRKVVQLRGMDAADRAEQEALLDVYLHALEQPDRIDARLEAGESQREIAKAENISKSTVQRRGPKTTRENDSSKMDHDPATGELKETLEADEASAVSEAIDQPLQAAPPAIESRSPETSSSDSQPLTKTSEPVVPTGNEGRAGERDPVRYFRDGVGNKTPIDDDLTIPLFLRRVHA